MNPDFSDRNETLENLKTDVWVASEILAKLAKDDISANSNKWIMDHILRVEKLLNSAKLKLTEQR